MSQDSAKTQADSGSEKKELNLLSATEDKNAEGETLEVQIKRVLSGLSAAQDKSEAKSLRFSPIVGFHPSPEVVKAERKADKPQKL